ncbi:MAG: DUF4252 domain-containing protein [Prevotellaceae bacterium]|jgi:hypothetical protein|nr:DUF4252 domain-containing protein [Prevotellaceae bacterium]
MKRTLLIVLIIVTFPLFSIAQLPSDAIFQKYADKEGYEVSLIPGLLLKPIAESYISSIKGEAKDKATAYLKNVTNIGILQINGQSEKRRKELLDEAGKLIKNSKYTDLISAKDDNLSIKIVTHKVGDQVTEILGLGDNGGETILVSIQGTFTEAMIKEALNTASKYIPINIGK